MADSKLFPGLPEDLADPRVSDENIVERIADYEAAIEKIKADDDEFLKGLSASEIIAQLKEGVEHLQALRTEQGARVSAHATYLAEIESTLAPLTPETEETEETEEELEVVAETETEEVEETVVEEEPVLVTASAEPFVVAPAPAPRLSRRPPVAPTPNREPVEAPTGTEVALVASSAFRGDHPDPLNQDTLASLMREVAIDVGAVAHDGKLVSRQRVDPWQVNIYADGRREEVGGGEIVWDGPKTKVARMEVPYSGDRTLDGGPDDYDKIRAVLPANVMFGGKSGQHGGQALTASGGLCAPLTPIYSMPNFGDDGTPVWDSFPVFRAARGGINVPTPTYIADITSAISSISEANDALGGTFATKSCQDLTCPAYTETAINIFAHCREYGNLNARAWPEKIAHENALTMQALSRTAETFMLDRIKSFFPNAINGATTLGSLIYVVEAIVRARFGIIGRLRMNPASRFRALMPYWVPDVLMLDTISTPYDRYRSKESLVEYLRSVGIDPVFYRDGVTGGTSQMPDSAQTAAAIDSTPATIQWALYPEGAVLGIDSGALELGIVRDSTLNSTNDFQNFGEYFRNVALIAPAQAGMWVTTTYCSQGSFPPAGTARTCP